MINCLFFVWKLQLSFMVTVCNGKLEVDCRRFLCSPCIFVLNSGHLFYVSTCTRHASTREPCWCFCQETCVVHRWRTAGRQVVWTGWKRQDTSSISEVLCWTKVSRLHLLDLSSIEHSTYISGIECEFHKFWKVREVSMRWILVLFHYNTYGM